MSPRDDPIVATERWFVKHGLPHFIRDYNAREDVFTRAVPALTFLFLLEIAVNAPKSSFAWWLNVLAVASGFVAVAAIWGIANRSRGRPTWERPRALGPVEVALFVVLPGVVPIVFGLQWRSGLVTALANVLLLGVIYLVTSYGLVPMTTWAFGYGVRRAVTVVGLIARVLPTLLLVIIVVFLTAEAWQVAGDLEWAELGVLLALMFGLGAGLALVKVPGQYRELGTSESWEERRARVAGTPAAPLLRPDEGEPPDPPLTKRQMGNVGLVILASEGILVTIVGVAVFAVLLGLSLLLVPPGLQAGWIEHAPDSLWSFDLFGGRKVVSAEAVKVCAFLGSLAALQFTVTLVSDGRQQEEYQADLRESLRDAIAVRAVYLAAGPTIAGDRPPPR